MQEKSNHLEEEVRLLYKSLLTNWNNNNALAFAELFAADGIAIGFDGSQMIGQKQITEELSRIFAYHQVSAYVHIVRELRSLSSSVFMLRAIVGMVPPGKSAINPKVNALQTMIAQKQGDQFRIALFQNTPAAFHEQPELSKHLTDELQAAHDNRKNGA